MQDTLDNLGIKDSDRQRAEVWCRCMGYFRPVSRYNAGKVSEYKERTFYKEPNNA